MPGLSWLAIFLFRYWFPELAAETIWDELSGLPIAALVSFFVKSLLVREQVFHLLVHMDVPGVSTVNLQLLRRREGWGILSMPVLYREAILQPGIALVRNISWWGVYGVDVCRLCFFNDDRATNYDSLEIPRALIQKYATISVKLSELSEDHTLVVSRQQTEHPVSE